MPRGSTTSPTSRVGETEYLSVADVQRLHLDIMARAGGASLLRDIGLLESAVMRPRQAAHYEGADLCMQSARLAAGIALASAFEDGNKRLAYAAAIAFLALNGIRLAVDPIALADQILLLVNRTQSLQGAEEQYAQWLRDHMR